MTMPRLSDPAAVASIARRALQWVALDRGMLGPFVLGEPTLRQRPEGAQPDPALAMLLQPYQYQLWRRRAAAVLGRLCRVAAVYALFVGLLRLRLAPDLPWFACWLPVLLLLCYGCALARRQRPGLYETARLLDRRYGLHEMLGTAAELGSPRVTDGLPALNLANALDAARRLPERAWEGGGRRRSRGLLFLALGAGAVAIWIAGPPLASSPHLAQQRLSAGHAATRLAQVVTRPEPALPRVQRAGTRLMPGAAHAPAALNPFAASLQTHAGPPLAPMPVAASAQAPVASLRGRLGAGQGGTQDGAASSLGGAPRSIAGSVSGRPSTAPPAPAPSQRRSASPSGSGSSGVGGQSQQAQQGSGATGSPGAQNGSAGGQQPAGSAQADASQGAPAGAQPGANSRQGANPFGKDPAASPGAGPASGRPATGTARRAPSGTSAQGRPQVPPTTRRTQSPGGGSAADNGLDPRLGRHGNTGGSTQRHVQAPTRQAGTAQGPEIVLGSGTAAQAQVADPQLVRVVSSGSTSLSDLRTTGQLGPQRVQGYVPEDATLVSPAEQALLLAYFAQKGSGS